MSNDYAQILTEGDYVEIIGTIADANGPIDLTDSTVKAQLRNTSSNVLSEFDCIFNDPRTDGKAKVQKTDAKTLIAGIYKIRYKRTYNGELTVFPNIENELLILVKEKWV